MHDRISVFRSLEGEEEYRAAYDAVLRQWPLPYEEHDVTTRFGHTHVIVSGRSDGPPVVLLHPAGGGAVIWYRNVGALGERFRTYSVDTIGEPNKSVLTRPIHHRSQSREFAEWMQDLFGGLEIPVASVVGNSFGGFVAATTAIQRPHLVRKLVLISPAATLAAIPPWFWHFIPVSLIGTIAGSQALLMRPYRWIWQGFPIDAEFARLRTLTATVGRPRHWPPTVFSDEELRSILAPTLLLIGEREVIYRPSAVIARAEHTLPSVESAIIPAANHNAEYTAAGTVNAHLLRFLSER